MAEIKFRIPENLEIKTVIIANKEVFYSNNLKEDKLLFICDSVIKSRAQNRKKMEEEGLKHTPLSSEIMQEIIYDYKAHLDFLLANGVLLTDNHFIPGEKCKGFCFNYPYAGKQLKDVTVKNYILKKAIRRAAEKRNKTLKKSVYGYGYLVEWWESGKLKIDLKAAYKWIENYQQEKIARINSGTTLTPIKRASALKNAIDTTVDFKELVDSINNNPPKYSFSGEGHRFYNPITNLKRELRNFLTYNGQPLVEIDVKNSQPFFSVALFDDLFWLPQAIKVFGKINLKEISKNVFNNIKNNKEYKHIITLLKTFKSPTSQASSFKKYTDLVEEGGLYEYIQKSFQPLYPDRFLNRNDVKKELLRIFYVENWKFNWEFYKPCKTFSSHFPEVHQIFNLIKEREYTNLAIILQRIESFLIIDIVCKEIAKKFPNIPLFTIHDSMITTKGNEAIIASIMSAEIRKYIGHKPPLGIKDLVVWKTVQDYEGYYEISSSGTVRSMDRQVPYSGGTRTLKSKVITSRINNRGYKDVRLSKDGKTSTKLVHILTADAYVSNPNNKPYVNHRDGNKLNNHYTNFSWVSHSENIQHAYDTGLIKIKSKAVVNECTGETFISIKEAAKAININYGTCRNYLNGKIKTNKTCLKLAS